MDEWIFIGIEILFASVLFYFLWSLLVWQPKEFLEWATMVGMFCITSVAHHFLE